MSHIFHNCEDADAEIERLRAENAELIDESAKLSGHIDKQATEIDRLRAENARLRDFTVVGQTLEENGRLRAEVAHEQKLNSTLALDNDRLRAENERLSAMSCPDLVPEVARLRAENEALRKGIQDYLNENYDGRPRRKRDKCPHETQGWLACEQCIDAHFMKLLRQQLVNDSLNTTTDKD